MKYAVITYIYGKNQEYLREPLIVDNNIEYICITDQPLTSKTWKIIYKPLIEIKSLRDKVALVKFNPFEYTNADRIIIQDSSLKCISNLNILFNDIEKYDICLKKHPERNNLAEELPKWKFRGLSDNQINKFYVMAKLNNIKLKDIPLYECCVLGIKNDEKTREIFNNLLLLMKLLGENGNMIVTQQCTFAYLIKIYYPTLNIGIINQHKFFIRYKHNTNKVNKL